MKKNTSIYCGWGRIIMGHTFADPAALATELCRERRGNRDIAFYVDQPHVVLSYAPQQLFLDPSDTFRLDLQNVQGIDDGPNDVTVRSISSENDAYAINELYLKRSMMPTDPNYVWQMRDAETIVFLVAEEPTTQRIVGTVMGINHRKLFDDPADGSSLWCLAVDPQARQPGLARHWSELWQVISNANNAYMDLSVMHDNEQAKSLYNKLGFEQVLSFAIKNKNAFNEALFVGPDLEGDLNPYAKIIVDEARARGITVEVLDAEEGYFRLSSGGKSITCRESLSELTSAVAMSRCQDKYVTNRWLSKAGLKTPAFQLAGSQESNLAFLNSITRWW
ncbi:MAG: GNAT family N-acetyltransferase [Candidatus Competibacteraceae bacterium]